MKYDVYDAIAREIIKELRGIGNFDEFSDDREESGIHQGCVLIIAQRMRELVEARDKQVKHYVESLVRLNAEFAALKATAQREIILTLEWALQWSASPREAQQAAIREFIAEEKAKDSE